MVITRVRLGHCGLRSGVALVGKRPDEQCECGEPETVAHVIQCKKYSSQWGKLFRDQGAARETVFNMHTLLNLGDWTKMGKLLQYLHSMGLYNYD